MKTLTLILGGARGGKSRYAEQLALDSGQPVLFVATAEAGDKEMAQRIARHQAERPDGWQTLEAPLDVGPAIRAATPTGADVVVVDCLTLLASNALLAHSSGNEPGPDAEQAVINETVALLAAYEAGSATWIVISNEVGMGLVPPYPLGRAYRDALGRANQMVAEAADKVVLLVAGLPWTLKG